VINLFLKWLESREKDAMAAIAAGRTAALTQAPRCHFYQTGFYTKLSGGEGGTYSYNNVRRWTKKVSIFSKELLIFPIHCHGNHWTLAVINFTKKRFEYYDSLFGTVGTILTNLRRWLHDESVDKMEVCLPQHSIPPPSPPLDGRAPSVPTSLV
jgi:sentrin-specific protease 1